MDNYCSKGSENLSRIESSVEIIKAISEPNRLRILCALSRTEICVCQLAIKLDISRNLLSFHLKTLFGVGILGKRRRGNQIFFFIKDEWKERVNSLFYFLGIN